MRLDHYNSHLGWLTTLHEAIILNGDGIARVRQSPSSSLLWSTIAMVTLSVTMLATTSVCFAITMVTTDGYGWRGVCQDCAVLWVVMWLLPLSLCLATPLIIGLQPAREVNKSLRYTDEPLNWFSLTQYERITHTYCTYVLHLFCLQLKRIYMYMYMYTQHIVNRYMYNI